MGLLLPELRRFPESGQRRKAIGRALSVAQFTPWYLVAVVGLFALSVFLIFAARRWDLPTDLRHAIGAWCVFGLPVVVLVLLLFCRRTIRRSIRRDLNAAGLPTCCSCGYDMSGAEGGRCPECGAESR